MYMHLELRGEGAGELTYLLGKNPERLFEWESNGAMVRAFFPVYQPDRARAVVTYWPSPLVGARSGQGTRGASVATRPFAIDSLFVSALEVAFGPIIRGQNPRDIALRPRDMEICLCPICTYLGVERIHALFEPLGYEVTVRELPAVRVPLANRHPKLLELTLAGTQVVGEALRHLMVMILVMDSDRHGYMDQKDVQRLIRLGRGWLDDHPDRPFIVSRFLLYRRLFDAFVQQARGGGGRASPDGYDAVGEPMPRRITPETFRTDELVRYLGGRPPGGRLLVVGAGDARLIGELASLGRYTDVVVVDPDQARLDRVRRRIERTGHYSAVLNGPKTTVDYHVSALGYRDTRLEGFDLALVAESIDHVPPDRVPRTLMPMLQQWRPKEIVLTVPNDAFDAAHHDRNGRRAAAHPADTKALVGACRVAGEQAGYDITLEDLGAPGHVPSPFLLVSFVQGGNRR